MCAVLGILSHPACAIEFQTLHHFDTPLGDPVTPLFEASDGALYGTASGGTNDFGAIFKITTNGELTSLWSFTGAGGKYPFAGLVQASDDAFYGTAKYGGTNNYGVIYKLTTNGVFTPLWSFTGGDDGRYPEAELVEASDGALYGTAQYGGSNDYGTVFRITTNGVFTALWSFTGGDDGKYPEAGLVDASDGSLYGTADDGGANGNGAVYRITATGTLTPLWSFSYDTDGGYPQAALVQASDGAFYGTAAYGGTNYYGTIFRVTTDGVMSVLWSFTGGSDGKYPVAPLVQASDGTLYGTARTGGTNDQGTIFKITTNGVLSPLWSFTYFGADGGYPEAALIQTGGGALYGTASDGGTSGLGVVFKITTNDMVTPLWSFEGTPEGVSLGAPLAQTVDGTFYGTASSGGTNDAGTIFAITTNGVITPLWSFTSGDNGRTPVAGLAVASDGALYGTTLDGGTDYFGTIFKITTNGVFTPLWSFTGGADGGTPEATLIHASDGALYGTSYYGGTNDDADLRFGTVFKITTNDVVDPLWWFTDGADGSHPIGGLVQVGDAFYGTTVGNEFVAGHDGTVFKITTNGVLTPLWSFTGGADGANPWGTLVLGNDGALYGTTYSGGSNSYGTIFKITTNGVMTPLWSFTGFEDGGFSEAGLLSADDGTLYGTTSYGGTNKLGTIFRITTDGVLTPVWSFTGFGEGAAPEASLIQAYDGALYGTTPSTVFRLVIASAMPAGYDAWAGRITNGLTNFYDSATGDGYVNLLKYATGSSPTNADDLARMSASISNGVLSLIFNRDTNTEDVTLTVEGSDAMKDGAVWQGIATNLHGSWGAATNATQIVGTNPVVVTVRDIVPPGTNRFLRLHVSRP